jgi:formiminoglutamase
VLPLVVTGKCHKFDAHSDFRILEGRHKEMYFYAYEEGFLKSILFLFYENHTSKGVY